jgi:hypothetical protein
MSNPDLIELPVIDHQPMYTAIKGAMEELNKIPEGQDKAVDKLFNAMHDFYWTECPCPADRPQRRTEEVGQEA